MRRFILFVALLLALGACGGSADDSSAPATSAPAQGESVDETAAPPETTATAAPTTTEVETATTSAPTTTTEAPAETTTTAGGVTSDGPFDLIPATPPAVFDSFVSTMTVQMGVEDQLFDISSDGSWTGDAFECTMTMSIGGMEFGQSVMGTPDTIWFDDGTGFEESSINPTTENVVSSCGASPSFWDDFVNPGVDISGETEQYAGRTAVKVDLREIIEYGGSLGVVPEVGDAVINTMDMWIDAETNVVLGIYADIAIDAEDVGDLGLPGGTDAETITMTMELSLDRINDPSISIEIPQG